MTMDLVNSIDDVWLAISGAEANGTDQWPVGSWCGISAPSFSWRKTGVYSSRMSSSSVRTKNDSVYEFTCLCWLASLLRTRSAGCTGCVCSTRQWAGCQQRPAVPATSQQESHGSRGCAEGGRDHHHGRRKARRSLLCPARPCVANLVRLTPIPVSGHGSLQRAAPPPLVPRLQQRLPGCEVVVTMARPQEPHTASCIVYSGLTLFPPGDGPSAYCSTGSWRASGWLFVAAAWGRLPDLVSTWFCLSYLYGHVYCTIPKVHVILVLDTLFCSAKVNSGCRAASWRCTQHLCFEYSSTATPTQTPYCSIAPLLVLFSNLAVPLHSPSRPNFSLSFATPGPTIEMGGCVRPQLRPWLAALHRKLFRLGQVTFAVTAQ
ncbi:hypothetical protein GGI43DRAFT_50076 [Trichoderma evansii]